MFGKFFIGKALAGVVVAGVLCGALATGVMAAPAATAAGPAAAGKQRAPRPHVIAGWVTAISDTQLTLKDRAGASKTVLRDAATTVYRGKDRASWSEIEVNSQVAVRSAARQGKLYAVRVQIGRAHIAGKVLGVDGNTISIETRDGKDVKISVTAQTKYVERLGKGQRKAASLSDIHAGQRLAAAGSWDKNGNLDAALVLFRNPATR